MTYTGKILITSVFSRTWNHVGRIAIYRELDRGSYLFLYQERAQVERLTKHDALTDAEMLAMDYIDKNPSVKLKIVKESIE